MRTEEEEQAWCKEAMKPGVLIATLFCVPAAVCSEAGQGAQQRKTRREHVALLSSSITYWNIWDLGTKCLLKKGNILLNNLSVIKIG